jgi:hypothetical protein
MLKRLTIALSVTALVAIGLFGQVVSAAANGGGGSGKSGGFHCSGVVTVCVGEINGNPVTVSPSVTISGNDVSVLENFLNHDSVNVANISDVQTQINVLALDVSNFLNHSLNINVCQVKVAEIGLVNTNIATCKQ